MTQQIYFVAGEDLDLLNVGGCGINTGGQFRPAYARCSLQVNNQNYSPPVLHSYWQTNGAVFNQSNFWMTARCEDNTYGLGTGAGGQCFLVRWLDSSGTPRLQVGGLASSNYQTDALNGMSLQSLDSAGNITYLANTAFGGGFVGGYIAKLDFQVNYSNSGSFTMHVDTIPILSYSGNLTTNGVTNLAGFCLGFGMQPGGGVNGATAGICNWSEIIIAATDSRSLSLQTLAPSGNGVSDQWTGTYNNINEVVINDSSGISSNAANQISFFQQSGSFVAPYVAAVAISARPITTSSGPQHMELAVHENGNNYTSGTFSPPTYFGTAQYIWNTDPSTGTFWSNTANVQIGAISLT